LGNLKKEKNVAKETDLFVDMLLGEGFCLVAYVAVVA
jgi:hypothetical protein